MNRKPTPKEISDKYFSLPEDMKRVISDESVAYDLEQLGVKYGLRVDKIDTFIEEVSFIMLGFKKTNEFIKSLTKELDIDRETAESIAIDVDTEVFKKIRESLQTVQYGDTTTHDKGHEDPVPSPARDSLLQDIEQHAAETPLGSAQNVDMSASYSSADYDPSSFASTVQATTSSPRKDTYRESVDDSYQDYSQEPLPTEKAETPYERSLHEQEETEIEIPGTGTIAKDSINLGQVVTGRSTQPHVEANTVSAGQSAASTEVPVGFEDMMTNTSRATMKTESLTTNRDTASGSSRLSLNTEPAIESKTEMGMEQSASEQPPAPRPSDPYRESID